MIRKKIANLIKMFKEYMQDVHGISRRRELQKKYFEVEEEKKKDYNIFIDSYTDTVIEMDLFMDHLSYDSQKIDALMNYYQISYKRVHLSISHLWLLKIIETKSCFFGGI